MRINFRARPVTKGAVSALLVAALLFVAGCTTVPPAQVTAFAQGVDAVKLQLDTTFASINQLASEDEIDRVAAQSNFTEEDLGVVLKPGDITKWDTAFGAMDTYAANLSLLISPDRANEFGTAAEGLGTAISKLDKDALPSPGVSAGFIELGRLLIQAKAEHDAIQAARQANPAMEKIFSAMADVIGETKEKGLRNTAWSHWQLRITDRHAAFVGAKPDARRAILVAYVGLRDKRDAQDLQLGRLRQSLLDLAAAHAALARGSQADLATAIGRIQQELDATRALEDHFKSLKPKS
jgi:hypothetical protein